MTSSTAFADDCLLNQEYFEAEATALARRHADAEYIREQRLVRWNSKDMGTVAAVVGGCESFGLEATSERQMAKRSSRSAILAMAKRLALLSWPDPYGREAAAILARKPRAIRQQASGIAFEFAAAEYMDFSVSQSFEAGLEKITISAIHLQ
ncbi:hypothetical protein RQP53_20965 [Paucibacter sp. APW11]|uniref:Uncharacterized protein n=1 Tax=Roseateles aquae TaxID=3077235 RepID=A0ABU3PGN6_9BURK|nr:hypothetical protein [Paucibacter sp. APW11]MDT9001761.1 hypothetical protein [Paucibacter sp. APW11]